MKTAQECYEASQLTESTLQNKNDKEADLFIDQYLCPIISEGNYRYTHLFEVPEPHDNMSRQKTLAKINVLGKILLDRGFQITINDLLTRDSHPGDSISMIIDWSNPIIVTQE